MNNILRIRNIEKYYGNRTNLTKAIDNISFDVNEGEFVAIMGASGSGKTTLLNGHVLPVILRFIFRKKPISVRTLTHGAVLTT